MIADPVFLGREQTLFDGRTTAGWQEVTGLPFPSECWAVEDGCLEAFPGPKGNQDIRTVAEYTDFEFQFAWRARDRRRIGRRPADREFREVDRGRCGAKRQRLRADNAERRRQRRGSARAQQRPAVQHLSAGMLFF